MSALDRLKEDHRRLSAKISVLESALQAGTEGWFVVRETCFSISKQLREHIVREGRLVAACNRELGQIDSHELNRFAIEHHDARQRLQAINRFLVGASCISLEGMHPSLTGVIATLRHQMSEQEAALFPILELVLGLQGVVFGKDEVSAPAGLTEAMTVQQVVMQYPQTKAIFEQFHVNDVFERYETLAAVAWCHGVGSRRLLAHLERAIFCGHKGPLNN